MKFGGISFGPFGMAPPPKHRIRAELMARIADDVYTRTVFCSCECHNGQDCFNQLNESFSERDNILQVGCWKYQDYYDKLGLSDLYELSDTDVVWDVHDL